MATMNPIASYDPITDNSGGATANGTIGVVTAPTALTDNSSGSATATLAAITSTTPADLAAVGVQLGVIKDAIASIAARQAENRTAIVALTDAVKEITTKIAEMVL